MTRIKILMKKSLHHLHRLGVVQALVLVSLRHTLALLEASDKLTTLLNNHQQARMVMSPRALRVLLLRGQRAV